MPTFTVRRLFAAALAVASAFTVFTLIPTAAASADPSGNDWARIRMCESSGNYRIIDGTGTHFGAYQFDQGTWNSVGGRNRPDQASPAEQDYRALYLYRLRGWQPWQCADASHLNLRNDGDGARGRIPTYAQSAYMGGGGPVGPPVSTPPPSSGSPSAALAAAISTDQLRHPAARFRCRCRARDPHPHHPLWGMLPSADPMAAADEQLRLPPRDYRL